MKHLNPATYLMTFMCALLVACASLGVPAPQTMNEKIAAAQAAITQVRVSATQLLNGGKISAADGENVLTTTDAAAKGVEVARTISAQDPTAAQAKLTAIVTGLSALQLYLASRQK